MSNAIKLAALSSAVKEGESLDILVAVGAGAYLVLSSFTGFELRDEAIAGAILIAASLRAHLTRKKRKARKRKKQQDESSG